jgi:TolB-like protein
MTPDPAERRLAAIMFTDIVGYTTLMAESEAKGHRVRERHRQVLRPLVERYGGTWVQDVGDESLSSFPSAVDAVNCALAIQATLVEEPELHVRIGIHVGDVVMREGSLHGDGVNLAARIRPLAEPGGVCVSDEVQHAIQNQENLTTHSLGARELKNVPRAVEAWWITRSPSGLPPIRSLAVLPLENLSGDPEQEYFADGMTEALIGDLAKIGALRVISRTSVMQYRHAPKSLPDIARELDVEGIIEGTVKRDGDRVRITAQLIDARDDRHLWSERYDRELRDILALHSDVARAVAEQVRLELTPEEEARLHTKRSVDPEAHDSYLRGLEFRSSVGLAQGWAPASIAQFERAIVLDSKFAEAYAALAQARFYLGTTGYVPSELPKAREAARTALDLDDRLGEAHAVLAAVRLWHDWDFPGARRAYARALELSPGNPTALNNYAWYLILVEKRTEEALDLFEKISRVAPLDPFHRQRRPRSFVFARQYDRALAEVERVRAQDPEYAEIDIAVLYFMRGRLEEAQRMLVAAWKRCGPPCKWQAEAMEQGWVEGGWEGSVHALLEAATEREETSPYLVAFFYNLIGATDDTFVWLERGYREREPMMINLNSYPSWDPLRSDTRFQDLLRRIGFPES